VKDNDEKATHIARAKALLGTVWFATMATVNEDGSPHNTPFLFLRAKDLSRIYWGSHPNSLHSKNIVRRVKLSLCFMMRISEAVCI
jgi:general stress protein 26